ncbi:MAG: beta-lactamase family protein [Caulobacter sp.]|nr:beta-lactamase family protein [Caulobacter sp.]
MAKRWLIRNPNLFSGAPQAQNFRDFVSAYPVRVVRRSNNPRPLPKGKRIALPSAYEFSGLVRQTRGFLRETDTTGMLVLVDGHVVYETYTHPLNRTTPWPCWSITKSFVSFLVGIAISKGVISGVDTRVTDLAPELGGSGYDGVTLHDVLTMSSGVRWYENYADPEADNRRHGVVHATGGSLDAFAASLPREWEPGTKLRYNSIDTNVLSLVLRRATDRLLSDLMHEWLWDPLGAEAEAFMTVDGEGAEWAGAGLICTLRDRARLGLTIAANGDDLVPSNWVQAATQPSAPHLTGENSTAKPFGYGYQFWLHEGACSAIGIYNQYCWVDASRRVVIAKASANRNYGRSFNEAGYRDLEHMALFQSIASHVCG